MSDLARRKVEVTFTFYGDGSTVTLKNHAVICDIASGGLESGVMCQIRIYGMSLSRMNQLSTSQTGFIAQTLNSITVKAGAEGEALRPVFQGDIVQAFVDFSGVPDVAFNVTGLSMGAINAKPASPVSYPDGARVQDIMATLAVNAGLMFHNNGVDAALPGSLYFSGTCTDQIRDCANAARISWLVSMNTLSIWPQNFALPSDISGLPEISEATGMVDYPSYYAGGVNVQTFFNPLINFRDAFNLKSQYSPASMISNYGVPLASSAGEVVRPATEGVWIVQNVRHSIASETLGGPWFTMITASRSTQTGTSDFAR
ncbi:baseplate hub protein [Acetobacter sp.]|uniref:baseplate hub protein n=1 Tax=Acetobacter sp. TaxID=440 RepID=UPI0039EBA223